MQSSGHGDTTGCVITCLGPFGMMRVQDACDLRCDVVVGIVWGEGLCPLQLSKDGGQDCLATQLIRAV